MLLLHVEPMKDKSHELYSTIDPMFSDLLIVSWMILEQEVFFPLIKVVIKVMLDQDQFVRHVVRPYRKSFIVVSNAKTGSYSSVR